ncbi:hypothetical protein CEP54_001409 [Fusarium duplospermum]|uniref:Uncharacterized protein n=1 Tax=Fusarium duplospermum TaxID=1325734 RepID=A0A428R0L1_9HYPO|nr:hypothetical protein CEP54_001409 [Fusarium duplospermum]
MEEYPYGTTTAVGVAVTRRSAEADESGRSLRIGPSGTSRLSPTTWKLVLVADQGKQAGQSDVPLVPDAGTAPGSILGAGGFSGRMPVLVLCYRNGRSAGAFPFWYLCPGGRAYKLQS